MFCRKFSIKCSVENLVSDFTRGMLARVCECDTIPAYELFLQREKEDGGFVLGGGDGNKIRRNRLEGGSNSFYGEYYWMSGLPILLNCFKSLVINTPKVKIFYLAEAR